MLSVTAEHALRALAEMARPRQGEARAEHEDPVEAWRSLVEDPTKRARWQKARGKGGFRRLDWETVVELAKATPIQPLSTPPAH